MERSGRLSNTNTASSPDNKVNQKLNALRIQSIRQARNAARNPRSMDALVTRYTFNDPSLPVALGSGPRAPPAPRPMPTLRTVPGRGHIAPPSWRSSATGESITSASSSSARGQAGPQNTSSTPADRFNALTLGWAHTSLIPPPMNPEDERTEDGGLVMPSLVDLAIQTLFENPEYLAASLTVLPPHLRRRVARHAAVHFPDAFFGSFRVWRYDGGEEEPEDDESITFFDAVSDGDEVNYVGDGQSMGPVRKYFDTYAEAIEAEGQRDDWDVVSSPPSPTLQHARPLPSVNPLTSLHLMDVPLASVVSALHLLPPTLTRLSLLALKGPPTTKPMVKRLSKRLPSLEVLDLSYNDAWLDVLNQCLEVKWKKEWQAMSVFGARQAKREDNVIRWVEDDEGLRTSAELDTREMARLWQIMHQQRTACTIRIAY